MLRQLESAPDDALPVALRVALRAAQKVSVPAIVELGVDGAPRLAMVAGMARKIRVQYPGAIYHMMNRGDRREPIFRDNADQRRFLEAVAETCAKTGGQFHAYCLIKGAVRLV